MGGPDDIGATEICSGENLESAYSGNAENASADSAEAGVDAQTKIMLNLLSKSLERQIEASERTGQKVEALGDRFDHGLAQMGREMGREMREGMKSQSKAMFWILMVSIILLGSVAGVQFYGNFAGATIGTNGASSPRADVVENESLLDPPSVVESIAP